MIGPPHRAAFRPTHQRRLTHKSPTDPPTRARASPSARPAAPRTARKHKAARPRGQGRVSPRQEQHRTRASRPLAPEKSWGQPAGAVVRGARKPPSHTDAYPELSPRNLPVGVAIAIGPSREKPGSTPSGAFVGAAAPSYAFIVAITLCRSIYLLPETTCTGLTELSPSKSSRASRCLWLCESSHSACGCASHFCPPWH